MKRTVLILMILVSISVCFAASPKRFKGKLKKYQNSYEKKLSQRERDVEEGKPYAEHRLALEKEKKAACDRFDSHIKSGDDQKALKAGLVYDIFGSYEKIYSAMYYLTRSLDDAQEEGFSDVEKESDRILSKLKAIEKDIDSSFKKLKSSH